MITADDNAEETFTGTIQYLKEKALKQQVIIEDKDIMSATGISESQFQLYLEKDTALEEIFVQLRSIYKDYLKGVLIQKIQFDVEMPDPMTEEDWGDADRPDSSNEKALPLCGKATPDYYLMTLLRYYLFLRFRNNGRFLWQHPLP